MSASEWAFIDRETDFRDNAKAWTSWESGLSDEDEEWDAKTMCNGENNFNTMD